MPVVSSVIFSDPHLHSKIDYWLARVHLQVGKLIGVSLVTMTKATHHTFQTISSNQVNRFKLQGRKARTMFSSSIWSVGFASYLLVGVQALQDCSMFLGNPDTNSYFITSDIMQRGGWASDAYVDSYTIAQNWCAGSITAGTRLAVIKDSTFAQDFVSFMESQNFGDPWNFIALQKYANGSWYWGDGTNAPIDTTYWAPSQPSTQSCAILNAYMGDSTASKLSTVDCDFSTKFICEITGKSDPFPTLC
jgi:hypothetical protein